MLSKLYEILATLIQILTLIMLLRSMFYCLRVRKETNRWDFVLVISVIVTGIFLTGYNMTDKAYYLQRFPLNAFFYLGASWAFYINTKSVKDSLYTIQNVLKSELSSSEISAIQKINSETPSDTKIESVSSSVLDQFEMHKWIETSRLTMLIKLTPPEGSIDYKFRCEMLPKGFFKEQEHPDLFEVIYVDAGKIIDLSTGITYTKGESFPIPPGAPHFIKAIERSSITAYLTKV
jgi:quercetin dioxygenase-like cupin family protein